MLRKIVTVLRVGLRRKGFKSKKRPNDGEIAVYMGNGEKALVEFIGVVNLPLASGGALVLDDVVYVLSLRHSLISVSKLDSSGFVFHFGNTIFFSFIMVLMR